MCLILARLFLFSKIACTSEIDQSNQECFTFGQLSNIAQWHPGNSIKAFCFSNI